MVHLDGGSSGGGLVIRGSATQLAYPRPARLWASAEAHGARPAETWPGGHGELIGMPGHYGETEIAGALALTFTAKLSDCRSVTEVASAARAFESRARRPQFARAALAVAVGRRCCEVLASGFASAEEGAVALRALVALRDAELLAFGPPLQQAARAALVLTSGRLCGAEVTASSRAHSAAAEQWALQAQLLREYAEAGALASAGTAAVEAALRRALQGLLAGAGSRALARSAAHLRTGGDSVLRARSAAQVGAASPKSPQGGPGVAELPPTISEVVFQALRDAARVEDAGSGAVPGAHAELQHFGLIDHDVSRSLRERRASSEGSLFATMPNIKKPQAGYGFERVEDAVRKVALRSQALGHGRPTHVRGEVQAGMGAVGHAAFHSGASQTGIVPAHRRGMTTLQKALLPMHAAKAEPIRSTGGFQRIRAVGRPAPCSAP